MADEQVDFDAILKERQEAKLVLKELREHQVQVEDEREEAVDVHREVLDKHLKKAEENVTKSRTVDQALVEATTFRFLAECTGRQAEQLQSGLRTYDVSSFVDCLLRSMNTEDTDTQAIDIMKLGRTLVCNYKTIPCMDFMYGNEPDEEDGGKKQKERQIPSRQVMKEKNAVKPRELRTDQLEQTETDRQVALMKKELQRRKSCNFWTFVIHPTDFARSVENLFHSSFLVKDGWAQLDLNVTPPTITYRTPDIDEHGNTTMGNRADCSEFIMEFDSVQWQNVVDDYRINECVFPRD